MDWLVPYAATDPKTRLAPVLDDEERREFARAMLADVCRAVTRAVGEPTVLATAPVDVEYPVVIDDRPLTDAVNGHVEPPAAVVMADLPLVTAGAIDRLSAVEADVVLAPGLGGGTNVAVVRDPAFRFDYHGASIRDHRDAAAEIDATCGTVDSFRLAVDVDEPRDLPEVLLHGEGRASEWLHEAGFRVQTTDGRVAAERE